MRNLIRVRSGFTLVEILVVLLIVSIMSGIVIANLPSFTRNADFETETRRVKTLLELARDEAQMQSTEFGFKLSSGNFGQANGYSFFAYDELKQEWVPFEQTPFKVREFGEGIEAKLKIEGEKYSLDDKDKDATPPVMLLSSGEMTPFSLTILQGSDFERTLISDGFGDLTWQDEKDEKDEEAR